MRPGLLDALALEVAKLLDPLAAAVENPEALRRLLQALGAHSAEDALGDDSATLLAALKAVVDLTAQVESLSATESPSFADIAATLECSRQALSAVRAVRGVGSAGEAFAGLGEDLVAYIVGAYLRRWHPLAHTLAVLATVIEPAYEQEPAAPVVRDNQVVRDTYALDRFHFKRLVDLLRDPVATLRADYGSLTADGDDGSGFTKKLFPRLQRLLRVLGVTSRRGFRADEADGLGDAAAYLKDALVIYADDPLLGAEAEAGVVLNYSGKDQGDLGLVVSPFGALTTTRQVADWSIELSLAGDIDVVAYGRHGVTLVSPTDGLEVTGSLKATLPPPEEGRPAYVLGAPEGSRLEVGGASFKLETTLSEARQALALAADVTSSAIVIAPGDGDGFLSSILPADGLRTSFDLGLAWSNTHGLTLRGSAGLETVIPINRSVGGLRLSTLYLSLLARDERVTAEASADVHLSLGPVQAVIDRVGLAAVLSFPERDGNLGFAQLDLGFKPPSGIGLVVEAAGVATGGGFLFYDGAQKLYAGVLEISLSELFTLKAFGLITTQLPDGSPGFSLVIFLTAEDFQPIQLGMGFTLNGIGGMLAINRTFDEEALRNGMKSGILASILFPRDPVANAPAVINALSVAFPARRDAYLFGVLVKIGWFTPTLVAFDLALILEIGVRRHLLVLGRVSALLPSADNDLVRLNLESLGVIDFDEGTVALDAVLVDSRLVHKFVLTGAMALRARWSDGPGSTFVLAVGGLNPRFAPPAGLPKLDRLAIALSSGDNPRITCAAYFAITANTLQFGAHAELYAASYGFSVEGDIGFDVLIQYRPLHFIADFHASAQLKRGSTNLFKVTVNGSLEGPRPLRASGRASFEICWCDFSVRFDKTLVEGEPPPPPPAIDVLAVLREALADPHGWQAKSETSHGVVLRSLSNGDALIVDPVGRLEVRQQVVPLNTQRDVDLFGGAPVSGDRRFALAATLNGAPLQATAVREQFAPSQYFDLTDDEKLSGPSFVEMDAGIAVGDTAVAFADAEIVPAPIEYESFVIDDPDQAPAADERFKLEADALELLTLTGAAARAPVRRVGKARFRDAAAPPAVTMHATEWRIVSVDDRTPIAAPIEAKSWIEQHATLATLNREGVRWQLVPAHELSA